MQSYVNFDRNCRPCTDIVTMYRNILFLRPLVEQNTPYHRHRFIYTVDVYVLKHQNLTDAANILTNEIVEEKIIIIFSFNIQCDIPQNVYERMIASYYKSRIQPPCSHARRHITLYMELRVKDFPKGPYVAARVGFEPATFRSEGT